MLAAVWDTEGMAVRILVGDVRQRRAARGLERAWVEMAR